MSALHKLHALLVIALLMPLAVHANPDAGKFYFVAGTAMIYPDLEYEDPSLDAGDRLPRLARRLIRQPVSIPATAIDVSDIALIGGSIGYQFTEAVAGEAVVGLPGAVDFVGGGLLAPLGKFAEFKTGDFIPLLLNVLYRPLPGRTLRPYVGAGPALAIIRKADVTNPVVDGLLSIDFPTLNWGWGVQTGIQVDVTDQWFMRLDAKYLRVYVDEIDLKVRALGRSLDIPITDGEMSMPLISFGIGRTF